MFEYIVAGAALTAIVLFIRARRRKNRSGGVGVSKDPGNTHEH